MTKNKSRRKENAAPSPFEQARDELFQHIIRCGVLQAAAEHQREWLDDTMGYLSERYHELNDGELDELRKLGMRFCEPPKSKIESAMGDAASAA